MADVYLSIGSNEGDRLQNLQKSIQLLSLVPDVLVLKLSSVYETEPWGAGEQSKFLNAVVKIQTTIKPHELLKYIHGLEKELGRQREKKWGPRTLDIDILLYDSLVYSDAQLIIPHLHFQERRFVLEPLAEIAPHLIPPVSNGLQVIELLENCSDSSNVTRIAARLQEY